MSKTWTRAKKAKDLYSPRLRVAVECKDGTRTKQSFREACDVNAIIRRYDKTGVLTHINTVKAQFGDFSNLGDFRENLEKMQKAEESFMELPAKMRKKFRNDPLELIQFLSDKKNDAEAIEMGLIKAPKVPETPEKPKEPTK